jgi:uncharacterized protein (TIGR02147 family)
MKLIFQHDDYRTYLRKVVEQKRHIEKGFGLHSLADMARVQRPYFSKVMARNAELSQDQVYLLCSGLGLADDETRYFELLVELERTALAERRQVLSKTIESMAEEQRTTANNLSAGKESLDLAPSTNLLEYYLDPLIQIVHISLFIARFSSHPRSLAEALRINPARLNGIIERLLNMGLVAYEGSRLIPKRDSLHLDKRNTLFRSWRTQIKTLSLQRLSELPLDEQVSFTTVFSADAATRRAIHTLFLEFLKSCESLVKDAPSHQTYQLSFDLFPWTD